MRKWLPLGLFLILASLGFADSCATPPVPVPRPTPQAIEFYKSGNILWIVQNLWELAVPALILFTGFSAKIRRFCDGITKIWFWNTFFFVLFFLIIAAILTLPLDYYSGFLRPHAYGMSNQTLGRWVNHYLIGTGISTLIGIIIAWILYAIIRRSPRRWWLYVGILTFPLIVFMVIVQPIWIAPLFNKFGPMKDKELEQKILILASRAGIEGSRVYEVDKSADTNQINAYVTGIGVTKRIVIWDTAIKNFSEDELLFVMGHEMGHYVLHHMWWGLLVYTLISIVTLFLIYLVGGWCIRRWQGRFGFSEMSNIASLPLIFLLYGIFSILLAPAGNIFSQRIEHNADTFGLELTHLNHAAGTGFVKLQMNNLGYPWPGELYMLFRASHPSIGARITYFNTYAPYCHGEPLKYERFFKPHVSQGP